MNMILTASTFNFPLITLPYITRVLSVEGVGKVNVATSIAQYFSIGSDAWRANLWYSCMCTGKR